MSLGPDFREFIRDQLGQFGPVSIRNMFGGAGIYRDGLMFALIAKEVLYLKVDRLSEPDFLAEGLPPFQYASKDGRNVVMSYYRAPDRCLEDPSEMKVWADRALAAALRARTGRRRGRRQMA